MLILVSTPELNTAELALTLTPFDLRRLDAYANNLLDYHVILDLVPSLAKLYFEQRLGSNANANTNTDVRLSAVQSAVLLAIGLQRKSIEDVEAELQLPVSQALALFVKVVRKITNRLQDIQRAAISAGLPSAPAVATAVQTNGIAAIGAAKESGAVNDDSDAESAEAGAEVDGKNAAELNENEKDKERPEERAFREKQREMIAALDLSK